MNGRESIDREVCERLDASRSLIADMLSKGHLTDSDYGKSMVCLAHEWATHNSRQDAVQIVANLSDDYLRNQMPAQLIADAPFRQRADDLCRYLNTVPAGTPTKEDHDIDILLLTAPRAKA